LRLAELEAGERFTFICESGQAAKMAKVVACRNGQIEDQQSISGGVILTVSKKDA
jgi:hypothetical protein